MFKTVMGQCVNYIPYSLRPWIKSVPSIARLQRWLITRFLPDQPFVHTINVGPARGLRFEVSLPLDLPGFRSLNGGWSTRFGQYGQTTESHRLWRNDLGLWR
jgi:hypothetical protein